MKGEAEGVPPKRRALAVHRSASSLQRHPLRLATIAQASCRVASRLGTSPANSLRESAGEERRGAAFVAIVRCPREKSARERSAFRLAGNTRARLLPRLHLVPG